MNNLGLLQYVMSAFTDAYVTVDAANIPQHQTVWIHIQATPWWWSCISAWPDAGPDHWGGTTSPQRSLWWRTSPPWSTFPTSAPPPSAAFSLTPSLAPVARSRPGSWSSGAPEFGQTQRLCQPWWTGGFDCASVQRDRHFPGSRWLVFCRHRETADVEQLGAVGFLLVLGSVPVSDSRVPES